MAAYFGYLLLAGIQAPFFYKRDKLAQRKFDTRAYLFLCCIEIIFLAGLRGHTIGADTVTYLDALEHYRTLPAKELLIAPLVYPFDFEIGYFALTKLCAFLCLSKTEFLFLIALITYIPVFTAINYHSRIPYLSILSYFAFGMFAYSLGIFRQMIAISILLCGWKFVRERKLVPYLLVVGLAMTFHLTAVIAAALYVLYGMDWRRIVWLVFPVEAVLLLSGRYVVFLAAKLMPQYAHYLDGYFDQQGGSYLMLLLLNVVLLTCMILDKKDRFCDDMTICALVLAVLLQSIGYSMALFGRIVSYFSIYLIFAVPDVVYGMGEKWRKPAGLAAIVVLLVLAYLMIHGNTYITPYYTIFE